MTSVPPKEPAAPTPQTNDPPPKMNSEGKPKKEKKEKSATKGAAVKPPATKGKGFQS